MSAVDIDVGHVRYQHLSLTGVAKPSLGESQSLRGMAKLSGGVSVDNV